MAKVIAWWSGGITSAVTCKICIDLYGLENVRIIFIDTKNEDDDTYRFLIDCEKWYGKKIETITGVSNGYTIQDIWRKHKSLNVANGAICSNILKRKVRELWQETNEYDYQAFGFELSEYARAIALTKNHPKAKAIYPLLLYGLYKADCIKIIEAAELKIPIVYNLGYRNNNCFKTGCVQGGIGYWQKIRDEYPEKFKAMAAMEHELSASKGKPVTMLKDQSKDVAKTGNFQVFLKKNNQFPEIKDLSCFKPQKVNPLFECNGFCGVNDLVERSETEQQINYEPTLFD